jgi:hypothetical protein
MTIQAAKDFIGRTDQDQVIRKLARERFGDIVNVGVEHGFDFSRDEFDCAMRERKATGGNPGEDEPGDSCVNTCQCTEGDEPSGRCVQTCQCTEGEPNTCQCADAEPNTCQCADAEPSQTCQCVTNQ